MEKFQSDTSLSHNLLYVKKEKPTCKENFPKSHLLFILTGISEVEVILNITSDVVFPFILYPMCIWLFIIPDENSKQHNHSNLPDKADCRETDPNIGVLLAAEKIAHAVTTVPHGADSFCWCWSLLSLQRCRAVSHEIFIFADPWRGVLKSVCR